MLYNKADVLLQGSRIQLNEAMQIMKENPVYNTILARRSIRKFTEKPVEHVKIELLLRAAMAAPSACNLQPWTFIVVDEKGTLDQVKQATGQGHYNAPLAIVLCGTYKHIPWDGDDWKLDCGAAMQNMMLECVELGMASVCIGGFEENDLKKVLNIPSDITPVCIIEIGYPATERIPYTWYTESAVHWQKYDQNKERTMRTLQMLQDDIKSGLI